MMQTKRFSYLREFTNVPRKVGKILASALLVSTLFLQTARAGETDKKSSITIHESIGLPFRQNNVSLVSIKIGEEIMIAAAFAGGMANFFMDGLFKINQVGKIRLVMVLNRALEGNKQTASGSSQEIPTYVNGDFFMLNGRLSLLNPEISLLVKVIAASPSVEGYPGTINASLGFSSHF